MGVIKRIRPAVRGRGDTDNRSNGHTVPAGRLSVVVSADQGADRLRAWDDLVASHPHSDVTQLSAWTRVRALAGYSSLHVLLLDGEHIVAGAQVLVRHLKGLGRFGYVPYGPLVFPCVEDPDIVHERMADALGDLGQRRFRMLFIQPPQGAERASQALLRRGFRESDADVAPAASLHIDLRRDEAALRAGLDKRLRTWTNTWAQRGVAVRLAEERDLPLLAQLLGETAEHQGFVPFDLDYLTTMYRELGPAGHLIAFIGEAQGRPVATAVFTCCGSTVKVRFLGLSRREEGRRLNVPAAVYWTAMRWAKANGYEWFDFGGILPASVPALASGDPVDPSMLPGPDRYKARFGGGAYLYPPPVELIPSFALRKTYDMARKSDTGRRAVAWAKRRSRSGSITRHRAGG